MRRMVTVTLPIWIICGLFFLITIGLQMPALPKMWIYPLAQEITKAYASYKLEDLNTKESEHFIVKYHDMDKAVVPMVIAAAEQAYKPVTKSIGVAPAGKSTIVIMANRREMQKNFGWSADQSAMGVYWAGMIQILSPHVWVNGDNLALKTEDFIKNGPMAHEFTHLVVDSFARGNYPRWFTEGIAQYQEYKLNDYQWITPTNSLQQKLFTIAELEKDFDGLPNQALAYRQSFIAVRYIYEVYGEESVQAILQELSRGRTLRMAIKSVLHMDYQQFETAWQQWGRANIVHPVKQAV